jgi:GTP-binding protein HflX
VVKNTLHDLKADDKPSILIFNKMDLYEKNTFDQWLEEDVKIDLLKQLKKHWDSETQNNCIFIAATEKTNIEELRKILLDKVREMYGIRYPYKTVFYE